MKLTRIRTALFLVLAMAVLMSMAPTGQDGQALEAAVIPDVTSVKSGYWSDPSLWSSGAVPSTGDSVAINFGHMVVYDVLSQDVLGEVSINGTLQFSRNTSTKLKTNDNILVKAGGFLDMGTASDFIPKDVKAEVIWQLTQAQADAYVGGESFQAADKGLWAMSGSRWEVYGTPLLRPWTKLVGDVPAGATTVVVEHDVTDWHIGGAAVITQTSNPAIPIIDGLGRSTYRYDFENEIRTVTNLEQLADGKTRITFNQPLEYVHEGSAPYQGEVGLLGRNVRFETQLLGVTEADIAEDVGVRKFAHTMWMHGAKGDAQYGEFKYMGNYLKLGRYPIHTHRMQETSIGKVFRGNGIWYTGFRWVNIHSSYGVTVEDNVGFSSTQSGYFGEPDFYHDPDFPDSNRWIIEDVNHDLVYVHNLGVEANSVRFEDRGKGDFARHSTFWIADSEGYAFLGNTAVGTRGGRDTGGFLVGERDFNTPGTMGELFLKNESHSNQDNGFFHWNNRSAAFELIDSLMWRNGNYGMHLGAYTGEFMNYGSKLHGNTKGGVLSNSIDSFVQDSVMTDSPIGWDIGSYFAEQKPDEPHWNVRNSYKDVTVGYSHLHDVCTAGSTVEKAVLTGDCGADYSYVLGNTFENVTTPIDFGWSSNANSWHKVGGSVGLDPELPSSFYINRKDQNVIGNQGPESAAIVGDGSNSTYDAGFDALITPAGTSWIDYPPEITLDVTLSGKSATLKATATDDHDVPTVEFFVDWVKVATKTAPPYEVTVDLSDHTRKYAYIYARAFDDTVVFQHNIGLDSRGNGITGPYSQRAYSEVTEIGPEVLITPQGNQAPVVSAGSDTPVSLISGANLVGFVFDDGLPNPPSAVTTTWSKVSGPTPGASVTFGTPTALTTTATFDTEGVYVLELTADDSLLTGSDQVSVTVLSPSVLAAIDVDPAVTTTLPGGSVQFAASGQDQHGNSFLINPTWEVSGGGSIDQSGFFTASAAEGGPFTVTASDGSVSGTAMVSVVVQLVVSDLTVASGQAYQMGEGLGLADPVYIDRSYIYTDVPEIVQGEPQIQTANADKNRTETSFLTFAVNQDVTVYVAYDSRASSLPSWLSGWANMGQTLGTTDAPLNLYSQDFPASSITLGANSAAGASGAGSNYTVVVVGKGNSINQPPVVNAGPDQSAKLMNPAVVALNGSVSDDGLPNPSLATSQWSLLSGPVGSIVAFADPSNPVTFASFSALGVYTLSLSANDGEIITTDEVVITIIEPEALASITVDQAAATALPGGTVQFTASGLDQYGSPFAINPTWVVSGGGTIDQSGLFTVSTAEGGPFTVSASDGLVSGSATVSVVAQLEVSDLTVASGQAYQVVDGLSVGSPVYIDRDYTYTNVPAVTDGALYIQTANGDKNRTETSFLTFSVNRDVTVYVGYDSRATALPGWLAGWGNTGQALANTDVSLDIYSKEFAAGPINLGANFAAGASGAGSNYSVAIMPR